MSRAPHSPTREEHGPGPLYNTALARLGTQGGIVAELELYEYRYRGYMVLSGWEAQRIASSCPGQGVTTGGANWSCSSDEVTLAHGGWSTRLGVDQLASTRPEHYYLAASGRLLPLELRLGDYMRLHSPRPGPPTLMINGIVMHRVAETDPLRDAEAKIRAARVGRRHRVLDICTGLGYTAAASLSRGARVVTIELRREVLAMAEANPYASRLGLENATIIRGDAVEVVEALADEAFHRVVHDPPRFNVAGELYSASFYRQLYRVLKPGGILFHYTGEPMKTRGRGHGPVVRGVIERLRSTGFQVLGYDANALGVVARKPRR